MDHPSIGARSGPVSADSSRPEVGAASRIRSGPCADSGNGRIVSVRRSTTTARTSVPVAWLTTSRRPVVSNQHPPASNPGRPSVGRVASPDPVTGQISARPSTRVLIATARASRPGKGSSRRPARRYSPSTCSGAPGHSIDRRCTPAWLRSSRTRPSARGSGWIGGGPELTVGSTCRPVGFSGSSSVRDSTRVGPLPNRASQATWVPCAENRKLTRTGMRTGVLAGTSPATRAGMVASTGWATVDRVSVMPPPTGVRDRPSTVAGRRAEAGTGTPPRRPARCCSRPPPCGRSRRAPRFGRP